MINAEPILSMESITKAYSGRRVLDSLNLQVPPGRVLGLLGKNGSGKTTLLKCALGLVKPQRGSARLMGEDSWWLSAAVKSRLGYVPQVVQLYPWMRCQQVIDYTASFYPRWNHCLIERLVQQWEIDPYQRISALSVGNLQKLAIVLAMGHEPELLILDEPAASLDPVARREFLRELLSIASGGIGAELSSGAVPPGAGGGSVSGVPGGGGSSGGVRTIIFSTHITSDLERVADSVAILKAGKIAYHGELDTLKDSVKRLHLTAGRDLPSTLDLPGLLDSKVQGRSAMLTVSAYQPELADQLANQFAASVQVEDLNLEDIFLEMHQK